MKESDQLPGATAGSGTEIGELERTTIRKVTRRLIPFLFLLYIVAWLDRVNVGFAALQMNADLRIQRCDLWFRFGHFLSRVLPL